MSQLDISLLGLTSFDKHGFSIDTDWFSECEYTEVAPGVLRQAGILSNIDEFMNEYVGSRFDAVEGTHMYSNPSSEGLEGLLMANGFFLFIPVQEATKSDWQSIYEFGKEALLNADMITNYEELEENSYSLIVSSTNDDLDHSLVLFHVTPLGAIWITGMSEEEGPTMKSLLRNSQQEIKKSHRQRMKEDSENLESSYCDYEPSVVPNEDSIPYAPMYQLLNTNSEFDD